MSIAKISFVNRYFDILKSFVTSILNIIKWYAGNKQKI